MIAIGDGLYPPFLFSADDESSTSLSSDWRKLGPATAFSPTFRRLALVGERWPDLALEDSAADSAASARSTFRLVRGLFNFRSGWL